MKKKFKGIVSMFLAALLLIGAVGAGTATVGSTGSTVYAKSSIKLKKKNGKIYCYKNGKKVKNKWMTIKKYRYHFNKKGVAAVGSAKIKKVYYIFDANGRLIVKKKATVVTVNKTKYRVGSGGKAAPGWDSSKTYYYGTTGAQIKNSWTPDKKYYLGSNGKRVTGIKAIDVKVKDSIGLTFTETKLFVFDSSGKKNASKTTAIQKACVREKNISSLKAIIGKPKSSSYKRGCYDGPEVKGKYPYAGGKDGILKYSGFTVNTYKAPDGTEFFMSVKK